MAAFTSGGTSLLFSGLAVGVGVVDLSLQLNEANVKIAAINTAEDKAAALTQEHPNYLFLAISVLGLGLDIVDAARIIKGIVATKPLPEIVDVTTTAKWIDEVAEEVTKKAKLSTDELEKFKGQLKAEAEKLIIKGLSKEELLKFLEKKYLKINRSSSYSQFKQWLDKAAIEAEEELAKASEKFIDHLNEKLDTLSQKIHSIHQWIKQSLKEQPEYALTNVSNCSVKLDSDISYCRLEFIYENKIISYRYVNSVQGEVQKKLTYHGTSLIQDASKVVYYAVQLKAFKSTKEFMDWIETVKYNPSKQQKKEIA